MRHFHDNLDTIQKGGIGFFGSLPGNGIRIIWTGNKSVTEYQKKRGLKAPSKPARIYVHCSLHFGLQKGLQQ